MSMNAATDVNDQGSHRSSMNSMYRLQRHIYDATRAYYLLGRDQMLQDLSPNPNDSILEVGCGTGRNLLKAAELYPECKFFGVDISDEMLLSATAKIAAAGLEQKVSLFQGDATHLASHPGLSQLRFDRIYFSYTLSMIPEWQSALASAITLLSPTGRLHIVDFGPGTDLPKLFNKALRKWLDRFGVTPRDGLAQALAGSNFEQQLTSSYSLSHNSYAAHATIKRR